MIISLLKVVTAEDKTMHLDAEIEMEEFCTKSGRFPVVEKAPVQFRIRHVKNRQVLISGKARLVIAIPCDRCLKEVPYEFEIEFEKDVNLNELNQSEAHDETAEEKNYIDGYNLDVDKLLYNEILIGWPMKILCCEDCKGICNVCGQNLNEGTCDCEDTSLDPRMSVIRDVFKNFKEV